MNDIVGKIVSDDRLTTRILRDGQAVTPELAGQVMARLAAHMTATGRGRRWVANLLGVPRDALAAVLNGACAAEHEATIRMVDRWLEIEAQRKGPAPVILTTAVEKIVAAGRFAIRSQTMVLATGPAGIGKTISARALAEECPGSVFARVSAVGTSSVAVLHALATALGIGARSRRTAAELFAWIEGTLKDTGRLVIVDEAHRLAARQRDEALHVLRDLHDGAGVPMLLLGMPALKSYILAGRSEGEALDQLASRIGLFLDLAEDAGQGAGGDGGGRAGAGGGRLASMEDVKRFLAARQIRLTPGAEAYLFSLVNAFGAGAFRVVGCLLRMAAIVARGELVTEEMLRALQARRLGATAAAALESGMAIHGGYAVKAGA